MKSVRLRSAIICTATLLSVVGVFAACGGSTEPSTPPKDVTPATITALSTDTIRGVVGTPAPGALTVTVKNQAGEALDTTLVTFVVVTGGGSISATNTRTNSAGQATTTWNLGPTTGVQTVTATAGTLAPITFVAIAAAGIPTNIAKVVGDSQSARVGTAVAVAPSVKVTDNFGNPVANTLVGFTIGSGGGSITGGAVNTGPDGTATIGSWTLGSALGTNTLVATAGSSVTTTFTATATIGAAATLTFAPAGPFALNVGQTVSLTARVVDASGNVLPNPAVTYTTSSASVASVGTDGVVTATGPGSAQITGTSGAATGSATVTVTGHPSGASVVFSDTLNSTLGDVAFTNGSMMVAMNSLQYVAFFDPQTGSSSQGSALALSRPPSTLLAGTRSSGPALAVNIGTTTRVWFVDPASRTLVDSIDIAEAVQSSAIKSDGSRAYMLLSDGEVAVVDVATRGQLPRIQLGGGTSKLRIDAGDTLAYVSTTVGIIFEIDTRTNAVKRQMILSGAITDFAISPDGNSLYLLDGAAGIVRVYDIASLALQRTFVVSGSGTSISLSPDGRQVWITHNSTPTGVTWYTGTIANGFVSSGQITMLSAPARVYFSPTGNFAAITNAGGWVDIVR